MNEVTIEQAAKWFAVTNLGGPFMPWNSREVARDPHVRGDLPTYKVAPRDGEGCDHIYDREYQGIPEHEEALPQERYHWERSLRKELRAKNEKGYLLTHLRKLGLVLKAKS